jgi:hypothetical protein
LIEVGNCNQGWQKSFMSHCFWAKTINTRLPLSNPFM